MAANRSLDVVLAPMGSGKTHWSKKLNATHPEIAIDVDDAKDLSLEGHLKKLRRANLWEAHNELWHGMVRDHIDKVCPVGYAFLFLHDLYIFERFESLRDDVIGLYLMVPPFETRLARTTARPGHRHDGEMARLTQMNDRSAQKSLGLWEAKERKLRPFEERIVPVPLNWDEPFISEEGFWIPNIADGFQASAYARWAGMAQLDADGTRQKKLSDLNQGM
uniref:Uncharacterized protein n=1 Tax=viral metagenome TaxID=1070528 RepID=A0A2V0R9Y4_9ZZZZ